ncbi:60S ribosomal protein L28 like protein [Argiope bruennichi]|uniref:Large ribosomal subunit protein eL28 n=1 Tax=Argiope bruennichi TaxID=94029 RepID=A0A8T0FWC0_ARGBR|nr:60S ribosomal protein L28 like protein [Argiope bruennichi]
MKKIHSPRYCGTIQKNAIMIEPHSNKKGVNLVYKKKRCHRKPAKSLERVPLTKNARRTMTVIKKFVKRNQYRKDLKMLAFRRASAILKSQRASGTQKEDFQKET